jgi:integrase/recombinase XerD
MGHVSIVSTAYYLRWMPELAAVASLRLETRFGHLITGEAA